MLNLYSNGTVTVKNTETGALAQAILMEKNFDSLAVDLNGIPIIFERDNTMRYSATFASLNFELVRG